MPMPDKNGGIRIFVSHRLDLDAQTIPNPLYVPVRCGAVFDPRNRRRMAGDDTGDNISGRRLTFCELTVQYWAWKNVQADYYGLCHYRRYLSFARKRYPVTRHGMVHIQAMLPQDKFRYGLMDRAAMIRTIRGCDLVIPDPAPVALIPTPKGEQRTVRQLWEAHDGIYFEKKVIDRMFALIDELAPQYSGSARAYFAGDAHRGYNCYVMRRELFDRLCRFQFPILFALERELDMTDYSPQMRRTPGYVGEMLFGIFLHHLLTQEHWNVVQTQLLYFDDAARPAGPGGWLLRQLRFGGERLLRALADPVAPLGSRRREALKALLGRRAASTET